MTGGYVTLRVLVGPPGCGKSTYAQNYMRDCKYEDLHLSSDGIRKELYGDESIQGNSEEVFALMKSRALEAFDKGTNVIYDATNMTRKNRASILSMCPKYVKKIAIVVWAPIEVCIKRDSERERTVGKEVIDRMLKCFQAPWHDEGFDTISVSNNGFSDEFREEYKKKCISAMDIPHDNSHHTLSILDHCETAERLSWQFTNSYYVFRAAQWHDMGKPYCKRFADGKGNPTEEAHYYGHEGVSGWMSYGVVQSPYISWLISNHMIPFYNSKYYQNLPTFLKQDIDKLHEIDLAAH